MLVIGQWILLGIVVLLGIILLFKAAGYLLKFAFFIAVAAVIVYGFHSYSLLPEPAQKYIDELVSGKTVQKVKDWFHQRVYQEESEKTTQEEKDSTS